jgi:hypothetical protein
VRIKEPRGQRSAWGENHVCRGVPPIGTFSDSRRCCAFCVRRSVAILGFWVYLSILAGVILASLLVLDPGLLRDRMRPGGKRPPLGLHLFTIVLFLHWIVAGLDRGRFHWSDSVPLVGEFHTPCAPNRRRGPNLINGRERRHVTVTLCDLVVSTDIAAKVERATLAFPDAELNFDDVVVLSLVS